LRGARARLYRQSVFKHAFEGKLTADWRATSPNKLEDPETSQRSKMERSKVAPRHCGALQNAILGTQFEMPTLSFPQNTLHQTNENGPDECPGRNDLA